MINSVGECNKNVISDVRSERLYREAEDDFFYLKNTIAAQEKLLKALEYTPFMVKSIIMLASIYILDGRLEEALEVYKKAEAFMPDNMKIFAGLANIYEMLNDNQKAIEYVDKAVCAKNSRYSPLIKSLFELKAIILLKSNRLEDAKRLVFDSRVNLTAAESRELQASLNLKIKNSLKFNKKMQQCKLQLVK